MHKDQNLLKLLVCKISVRFIHIAPNRDSNRPSDSRGNQSSLPSLPSSFGTSDRCNGAKQQHLAITRRIMQGQCTPFFSLELRVEIITSLSSTDDDSSDRTCGYPMKENQRDHVRQVGTPMSAGGYGDWKSRTDLYVNM